MLMDVGFNVSKGGRGQKAVLSHETIISYTISIAFHASLQSCTSLHHYMYIITVLTAARQGGGISRCFPPSYRLVI